MGDAKKSGRFGWYVTQNGGQKHFLFCLYSILKPSKRVNKTFKRVLPYPGVFKDRLSSRLYEQTLYYFGGIDRKNFQIGKSDPFLGIFSQNYICIFCLQLLGLAYSVADTLQPWLVQLHALPRKLQSTH